MTLDQYTEVINRAANNLLSSTKKFKKAYNGSKTQSDFKKIENIGLSELSKNLEDKSGNPLYEESLVENGKVVYNEYNDDGSGKGDPIKVPDIEKILLISNEGMALTISYAMAVEIEKLLDEIAKLESRIEDLESSVKGLQSDVKDMKSRITELEKKVKDK